MKLKLEQYEMWRIQGSQIQDFSNSFTGMACAQLFWANALYLYTQQIHCSCEVKFSPRNLTYIDFKALVPNDFKIKLLTFCSRMYPLNFLNTGDVFKMEKKR